MRKCAVYAFQIVPANQQSKKHAIGEVALYVSKLHDPGRNTCALKFALDNASGDALTDASTDASIDASTDASGDASIDASGECAAATTWESITSNEPTWTEAARTANRNVKQNQWI